ncbi:MAG: alanine dehydrogenase [Bacteroidales bacterium]|jgi:alanine dehydrogenase|nr:alanine dehydrogenase [Bacteroidales bacterium]
MEVKTQFLFGRESLLVQEEMLEIHASERSITIGILKEIDADEKRMALTPQAVELLVQRGNRVLYEQHAAAPIHFSDEDYAAAGAEIFISKDDIFKADVIVKVGQLTDAEIDKLHENQTIISSFLINDYAKQQVQKLQQKKIIAIAYEYIHDTDNHYPFVCSMNEIAGTMSILVAAEYLSNSEHAKGVLLGGVTGISPAEVVILGANTAGEYAARAALGLGAQVKIFDTSLTRLTTIQAALGQRLFTSTFHPSVLRKAFQSADAVIGAVQQYRNEVSTYITEELVQCMKKSSIVIDLTMGQGGCFETSTATNHSQPTFTKHGVIHYCVPNINSRAARTASIALSNGVLPILFSINEMGGIKNCIKHDYTTRQGVYVFNGIVTNSFIANKLDIPFKHIDLLIAAI